jgi:hypothetical protein
MRVTRQHLCALAVMAALAACEQGPPENVPEQNGSAIVATRRCAGPTGAACPKGEYCQGSLEGRCPGPTETGVCQSPLGACGIGGHCQPRPQICILISAPVCGCDGQSYSSSCHAASVGVSVAKEGRCRPELF